jgi:hypothetical protein
MSATAGTFAVIERSGGDNRVLVLLDTKAEAEDIAIELRSRGLKVEVQQGLA